MLTAEWQGIMIHEYRSVGWVKLRILLRKVNCVCKHDSGLWRNEQATKIIIVKMMLLHLICLALICPVLNAANKCVKIETPLCQELVGSGYKYAKMYNMTMFPNILSHRNQEEAGLEVHQFFPLIKVACSEFLQLFLCSVYLPVCTNGRSPIPPCRSLCEKSRSGCLPLMASFGFQWPDILNCKKFPENNGKNLCIDVPTPAGNRWTVFFLFWF